MHALGCQARASEPEQVCASANATGMHKLLHMHAETLVTVRPCRMVCRLSTTTR